MESIVPIRNGERVWRVPVAHFTAFRLPEPVEEKAAEEKKADEPAKEEGK